MGRREARRAQARQNQTAAEKGKAASAWALRPQWWLGAAALFGVVAGVLYAPALHGPFVFDDVLLMESYLRGGLGAQVREIFSPGTLRRLSRLSFSLNHHFHGTRTFGYHVVNVAIHAVNGLLLFLVSRRILARAFPAAGEAARMIVAAFLGALLWLVHPVQVTAVAYVYQRQTSLCALFYLGAILAYLEGRIRSGRPRGIFYGLAIASGLCALFTKENAATLPVFVALLGLMFFDERPLHLDARKARAGLMLVIALGMIAWFYLGSRLPSMINRQDTEAAVSTPIRLLTQSRVVGRYVTILAFPQPGRLNFDADFPASQSLLKPPTTLLSILMIAVAGALSVYLLPRHRLASFAVFWFFGHLAIESTFIPLEHYYEYRLYLPSTIPFVVLVAYLARAARGVTAQRAVLAATAVAIVACGAWTRQHSRLFGDDLLLWEDNVRKSPGKARPHVNLGNSYHARGDTAKARGEYEKALALNPASVTASINLTKIHLDAQEYDRARTLTESVLRRDPENREALFNLAMVHLRQGRMQEGVVLLERVVARGPDRWAAYNLAVAYLDMGQPDRARPLIEKALALWPEDSYLTALMGRLYLEKGMREAGVGMLRQAVALDPRNAIARMALERVQR